MFSESSHFEKNCNFLELVKRRFTKARIDISNAWVFLYESVEDCMSKAWILFPYKSADLQPDNNTG